MREGTFSRYYRTLVAILALALALPLSAARADPPSTVEYRLGPGDQLRIVVFGQTELTGQYSVSAHGTVVYPLVGEISAAGLTLSEFDTAVTERLRQGFVRQPDVSIEIANYRPFYILGEVDAPGTYPFSAGLTVRRAVATAGGFTFRANTRRVFIQHWGESTERVYDLTSATQVMPGDVVRIPERWF